MPRNDMPGNLPEMSDDEVLDFLLSLQPERQREMTHAPRRDPKFPKSSVPYTSWKDDLPAGHTIADIGDYFEDSANAPLYPLYHNDAGRPRGNPENFIPPELRKFLRLPLNVGMDTLDLFKPDTPADYAMIGTYFVPGGAGMGGPLTKGIKRGYKAWQKHNPRAPARGPFSMMRPEQVGTRGTQSLISGAVADDMLKAFSEDEPKPRQLRDLIVEPGYAGGGKVTRRGVLAGLGALGVAGALGKKLPKVADDAAPLTRMVDEVPIRAFTPPVGKIVGGYYHSPRLPLIGRLMDWSQDDIDALYNIPDSFNVDAEFMHRLESAILNDDRDALAKMLGERMRSDDQDVVGIVDQYMEALPDYPRTRNKQSRRFSEEGIRLALEQSRYGDDMANIARQSLDLDDDALLKLYSNKYRNLVGEDLSGPNDFLNNAIVKKAGGGKVTRRGVLKGLGALGIAGALGKKGIKLGDEAAPIIDEVAPLARAATKAPWMPSPGGARIFKSWLDSTKDDQKIFEDVGDFDAAEESIPFRNSLRAILDPDTSDDDILRELDQMYEVYGPDDTMADLVSFLHKSGFPDSDRLAKYFKYDDEPPLNPDEVKELMGNYFDIDEMEKSKDFLNKTILGDKYDDFGDLPGPNDFLNDAIVKKAGGGKVTRRGVLKGLGALGIAGATGKGVLKSVDEAAGVAAPIERRVMAQAAKSGWVPSASTVQGAKGLADNFMKFLDEEAKASEDAGRYIDPDYYEETERLAATIRNLVDDSIPQDKRIRDFEEMVEAMTSQRGGDVDLEEIVDLLKKDGGYPGNLRHREDPDLDILGNEYDADYDLIRSNDFGDDLSGPNDFLNKAIKND